jgi:hypothetical protein
MAYHMAPPRRGLANLSRSYCRLMFLLIWNSPAIQASAFGRHVSFHDICFSLEHHLGLSVFPPSRFLCFFPRTALVAAKTLNAML